VALMAGSAGALMPVEWAAVREVAAEASGEAARSVAVPPGRAGRRWSRTSSPSAASERTGDLEARVAACRRHARALDGARCARETLARTDPYDRPAPPLREARWPRCDGDRRVAVVTAAPGVGRAVVAEMGALGWTDVSWSGAAASDAAMRSQWSALPPLPALGAAEQQRAVADSPRAGRRHDRGDEWDGRCAAGPAQAHCCAAWRAARGRGAGWHGM